MGRLRSDVLGWIEGGQVPPGRAHAALRAVDLIPGPREWRGFLGALTLWMGVVALAAAVIFFFAFNWDDLGRFAKFGLVEAAILTGLAALWRFGLDSAAGKAVLLLLSLLVGALLALAGQVYQTGADTFELFGWWAALILPWVLVGRFAPLWLVWLALLNMTVLTYFQLFHSGEALLWALFALNALALAAWEAGHRAGLSWLGDDWPPRLVAMASAAAATALIGWTTVNPRENGFVPLPTLFYLAWLAAFYGWYRHVRLDLFMLAAGLLSLIVTVVVFLAHEGGDGSFLLLIGLAVIAMSGGGAFWLRRVARELQA